jgi:hypothetical protein
MVEAASTERGVEQASAGGWGGVKEGNAQGTQRMKRAVTVMILL